MKGSKTAPTLKDRFGLYGRIVECDVRARAAECVHWRYFRLCKAPLTGRVRLSPFDEWGEPMGEYLEQHWLQRGWEVVVVGIPE